MPEEQKLDIQVRDMDQYTEAAKRTEPNYDTVVARLADPHVARLLHAAMGLVTEAAEFVDQLKRHLFYGKPLDNVNLLEELGDGSWYWRIALAALDSGIIPNLDQNVAKLRARFPQCFTEDKALTRDLDAERAVLEDEVLAIGPGWRVVQKRKPLDCQGVSTDGGRGKVSL